MFKVEQFMLGFSVIIATGSRDEQKGWIKSMQAIEFETWIDKNGYIVLPKEFQYAYGKPARLLVLLPEQKEPTRRQRRPGSAKGILQILSEDDEHLDDFKVYMP